MASLRRCTASPSVARLTVGQRPQDAKELQARVLLRELLQSPVPRCHVVQPLLPGPRHQHLQQHAANVLPYMTSVHGYDQPSSKATVREQLC